MSIMINGFTSDDKVPGAVGETKYGQGRVSIGGLPVYCTLMGGLLSGGTATADTDVHDIPDEDTANTLFGPKSELAVMCRAALEVPGVNLRACPVAEAGGATAATLTMLVAGTWSTAGTLSVRAGGKTFSIGVLAGDTVGAVATRLSAKINEDAGLFCVASIVTATVTLTVQSKSARGNDWIVVKLLDLAPAGLTLTLTGGTALAGGHVPFSGGAGADDIQNALDIMNPDVHDYIAAAQNDATNAALLETQVNTKAGPLEGRLEHYVYARARTQTDAISLAQTTMNEVRGCCLHLENSESHPMQLAAAFAAIRSVTEGSNPNPDYDDYVLPGIAPQTVTSTFPLRSELKSALNNGVTPLYTSDGKVLVARAITSHSLNGAAPDYRTLDLGDAVVPDRVRKELVAEYSIFKAANPYVGPDPADEERAAPAGVGTPSNWNSTIVFRLREFETNNWIADVDGNLPVSTWDDSGKRIMSAVPVEVRLIQHQIGISVRQQAA